MAGIIADLNWKGITVPSGYVEIHHIAGGPNYMITAECPSGQWLAFLYYYAKQADRMADINSNIPINDLELSQASIPYVKGLDPYESVLTVLQQWFPQGKVVVQ